VANPDPGKLSFKSGKAYLRQISEVLSETESVFVTNMDRKMAHYYKNRMAELLKVEVISEPAIYEGQEGYRFRLKRSARPSSRSTAVRSQSRPAFASSRPRSSPGS